MHMLRRGEGSSLQNMSISSDVQTASTPTCHNASSCAPRRHGTLASPRRWAHFPAAFLSARPCRALCPPNGGFNRAAWRMSNRQRCQQPTERCPGYVGERSWLVGAAVGPTLHLMQSEMARPWHVCKRFVSRQRDGLAPGAYTVPLRWPASLLACDANCRVAASPAGRPLPIAAPTASPRETGNITRGHARRRSHARAEASRGAVTSPRPRADLGAVALGSRVFFVRTSKQTIWV
ncbi:hypothetical protein FN846DRAFT_81323 [Sphaerosporella brunnea]|uniref:Uncharacterized protein n=1 Tax=Sphaerosporella brunnea TaxID=1250544 RepID=A0A5J5F973_9PEZI|nr:hypothetical protein FN846DRAFT_81323 [Sphaerosporella brunnea]